VEQKPDDKQSGLSAAFAALLSASAGAGIGWLTWQVTGSSAFGIGIAGPMALLSNNFITNVFLKGRG
jgi:hypothetical protein